MSLTNYLRLLHGNEVLLLSKYLKINDKKKSQLKANFEAFTSKEAFNSN